MGTCGRATRPRDILTPEARIVPDGRWISSLDRIGTRPNEEPGAQIPEEHHKTCLPGKMEACLDYSAAGF